jgi:GT2 family glycosyltransferase
MDTAVVVCTRNRFHDVRQLLAALPCQSRRPSLVVVDSSEDDRTESLVAEFADSGAWPDVRYLRSEPGLTRQRMVGVAALDRAIEIIHFIDDDVAPEPQYFEAIEAAFEREGVLGVGGWVTNTEPRRPSLIGRMFLLDSLRQGIVLPSGVNVIADEPRGDIPAQWLSGCAMSYRRSVFDSLSFDTEMEGYSLGEDLVFSHRVGRRGILVVTDRARLEHRRSKTGRWNEKRQIEETVSQRHAFVVDTRGEGTSLAAFWWSVFGDVAITAAKAVLDPGRAHWTMRLQGLAAGVRRVWRCDDGRS